jgi:hypothetical protein
LSAKTELLTVWYCNSWDLDSDRLVRNSKKEPYIFDDENEASVFLNKHYRPEQIDDEYRNRPNLVIDVEDSDEDDEEDSDEDDEDDSDNDWRHY